MADPFTLGLLGFAGLGALFGGKSQAGAARDVAEIQARTSLEATQMEIEAMLEAQEMASKATTEAARISAEAAREIARAQQEGLENDLAWQTEFINNYRTDLKAAVAEGRTSIQEAYSQARADLAAGGAAMEAAYLGGITELRPYTAAGINALARAETLFTEGPGVMTPQQEREFGRGIEAVQAASSKVSGGGVSSRMMENAMLFGQDYAARRFDEQLNRLVPFLELGQNAALTISALQAGRGNVLADLATTGATLSARGGEALADVAMGGVSGWVDRPVTEAPSVPEAFPVESTGGGLGFGVTGWAIEQARQRKIAEAGAAAEENALFRAPTVGSLGPEIGGMPSVFVNVPGMGLMPRYNL